MKFFLKPKFKWKEPRRFMHLRDQHNKSKIGIELKALNMLGIFLLLMAFWWIFKINPPEGKNPPEWWKAILLSIFLGWFIVFIVPIFDKYEVHNITLTSEKIITSRGTKVLSSRWTDLDDYGVSTIGGTPILWVSTNSKETLMIAIEDHIDLDALATFLQSTKKIDFA